MARGAGGFRCPGGGRPGTHAFPLNVRLAGNHHMEKSLERMVTAKALKPRLVLSQTLVDFRPPPPLVRERHG